MMDFNWITWFFILGTWVSLLIVVRQGAVLRQNYHDMRDEAFRLRDLPALWLLRPQGDHPEDIRSDPETMSSCVVRAYNEEEARNIAANHAGAEGVSIWMLSCYTSCENLSEGGPCKLVTSRFHEYDECWQASAEMCLDIEPYDFDELGE